MGAVLRLVLARWRHRPGRYLGPVIAVGLAAAFVVAALAAGTVAGDQAARDSLGAASPAARTFRVTDSGAVAATLDRSLRTVVAGAAGSPASESLLLGPVRLSGIVVRPAAVSPLSAWAPPAVASQVGPCRAAACPVLLASGPTTLTAPGVRLVRVGAAGGVVSAVPFGYAPGTPGGTPTPVTGDLAGLDALAGLSSDQRTRSWFAAVPPSSLHGWQLSAAERRMISAAAVSSTHPELVVATPVAALDAARSAYASGTRRMLPLAGGGAAILLLFVLLSGTGLRREQRAELMRMRAAGARTREAAGFVVAESVGLTVCGLLLGAVAGVVAAAVLAAASGEPVGGVLLHTSRAWLVLAALAVVAPCLLALATVARGGRAVELAVAAAAAALIGLLVDGSSPGGSQALALVCLATATGALVIWGVAGRALRLGSRATARAAPMTRLAFVSLGRAPVAPGLAVGLAAAGLGLAGFALTLRATADRGAADQAAAQVPLDVQIDPGADFRRPLSILPVAGWEQRVGGQVFGILHATASLPGHTGYTSVPLLGVPSAALPLLHGWRSSDGSAPLGVLARRLQPTGRPRTPGLPVPAGTSAIRVGLRSPHLGLSATAVLRDAGGRTTLVPLRLRGSVASGSLPRGDWSELQAIELAEPTGLEVTNGHQNGENPVGASEGSVNATVGPVSFLTAGGRMVGVGDVSHWTAVGPATAAAAGSAAGIGALPFRFSEAGVPGIVRPVQPTDHSALPVLADRATAAATGLGGRLSLSVNGLPVAARVVGTVARFPTAEAGPVLIADSAALSGAIEAGAPGQGLPDELWIAGGDPRRLGALLATPAFRPLVVRYRASIERAIQHAPLARVADHLLLAEAVLVGVLGIAGIFLFVVWARDPALEDDLIAQGLGPRELRRLARVRGAVVAAAGLLAGVAMLALLLVLVIPVAHAVSSASPEPPFVLVLPVLGLLVAWAVAAGVLAVAAWKPR